MIVKGLNMIINIVALIVLMILIIIGIKNDVNNKNDICDDDILLYEDGKITDKYAISVLTSMLALYTTTFSETEKEAIQRACVALSKLSKIEEYIQKTEDDGK